MNRKGRLREILEKACSLQDENEEPINKLRSAHEIITKTNECMNKDIKERASNIDEILIDAKIISSVVQVCLVAVETLNVHTDAYSIDDFAQNLKRFVQPENDSNETIPNWCRLDDEALELFNLPPTYSYIYGAFDMIFTANETLNQQEKTRKQRVKILQAREKSQPENIRIIEKEEESVDETVKIMLSILREIFKENSIKSLSYYHFILDPNDFGKTLDNIFYFSFLIRDGAVRLKAENNAPFISLTPKSNDKIPEAHSATHEQIQQVMSLDYENWEALTNVIDSGLYSNKRQMRKNKR